MKVAPDTMSIWALWACRTSLLRIGTAWELISWSRGLSHGTWVTTDFVILPPATVICTWTVPYCIITPVPVYVFAAAVEPEAVEPDDEPELPDDDPEDEDPDEADPDEDDPLVPVVAPVDADPLDVVGVPELLAEESVVAPAEEFTEPLTAIEWMLVAAFELVDV